MARNTAEALIVGLMGQNTLVTGMRTKLKDLAHISGKMGGFLKVNGLIIIWMESVNILG